jgi:hypothetical protein
VPHRPTGGVGRHGRRYAGRECSGDLGSYDVDHRPSFLTYGLVVDFGNNWGWTYQTAKNGSWVNASIPPGNSGDITG